MNKKILIVVDYQNDFVDPTGALPVPEADQISQNIQNRIDSDEYDNIIYTFDTHTPEQYNGSEEQQIFPNIHCEFGTDGWNFFNITPKNNTSFQETIRKLDEPFKSMEIGNESFFTKDVFNIWDGNDSYPDWFTNSFPANEYEIDVVGVATNYCVFMNVMGMVEKGYKINVINDAVEGIKAFPDGTVDESFEQNITTMKGNNVKFV